MRKSELKKYSGLTIQEFLGLPNETSVMLADHDLPLFIRPEDYKAAQAVNGRNDPRLCVLGQCFSRATGHVGAFFQRFAYVPRVWRGKLAIFKYQMSAGVGKMIAKYDHNAKRPTSLVITLLPIPPSWHPEKRQQYALAGKKRREAGITPRAKKPVDPSLRTMRFKIGLASAGA